MSQQKATGWKVPLLFCAVMGVAVLGTWLWGHPGHPPGAPRGPRRGGGGPPAPQPPGAAPPGPQPRVLPPMTARTPAWRP